MPKAGEAASKPNSDIVEMPGQPRVSPEEVVEPQQLWIEDNEDTYLKALIARDLEKGMGVNKKYADKLIGDPFWPIGLCAARGLGEIRPRPHTMRDTDWGSASFTSMIGFAHGHRFFAP
jgi:hypothetical protein